jgi:hypothetical protein
MTEQLPPYEDVEPRVNTRKTNDLPAVVDAQDTQQYAMRPAQGAQRPEPAEPLPQPWNEARILRVASIFVATGFIIMFVVMAARACPIYLAWAPFLVGALPYLGYAGLALSKHLDDESASRERRERWEHSRLDVVPLGEIKPDAERWQ